MWLTLMGMCTTLHLPSGMPRPSLTFGCSSSLSLLPSVPALSSILGPCPPQLRWMLPSSHPWPSDWGDSDVFETTLHPHQPTSLLYCPYKLCFPAAPILPRTCAMAQAELWPTPPSSFISCQQENKEIINRKLICREGPGNGLGSWARLCLALAGAGGGAAGRTAQPRAMHTVGLGHWGVLGGI